MFVHGSMDRSSAFARCVGHLRDVHTIRYDRRGYGKSRDRGAPPLAGHVDDLVAVIDGRECVVVGHSLGGVIALAAAQQRPDAIHAVGAYEAPMPWIEWWPKRSAGGDAMTMGEVSTPEAAADAAEQFMRRILGDERWESLPQSTRDARRAEGPALLAELGSARAAPAYDPTAIKVPVVAGHSTGSSDHHRWAAQELARLTGGGAPFVIDGAGHGAHASHHAEFAAFVRAVLAAGR